MMTTDNSGQGDAMRRRPAKFVAMMVAGGAQTTYLLYFPAPNEDEVAFCAPAKLVLGDGTVKDLGVLCAPTQTTWAANHVMTLAEGVPVAPDGQEASLVWGPYTLTPEVVDGELVTTAEAPAVKLLTVATVADSPMDLLVGVEISNLPTGQRVRLDGGAGDLQWWTPPAVGRGEGLTYRIELIFSYSKPGDYELAVDVVDEDGYLLTRAAEQAITVQPPIDDPVTEDQADQTQDPLPPTAVELTEVVPAADTLPAWLPFRYVRPMWAWARTYTQPGGAVVSRSLALGTYLAIRQEVMVGSQLWYQTSGYDWIPASSVSVLTTSELRGVVLADTGPDPEEPDPEEPDPEEPDPEEPEPDPDTLPKGIVTAHVLNVRSGPGTQYSVVDQLRADTQVIIYEKTVSAGATWYRIDVGRWVHGGWIRLLEDGEPQPEPTRRGIVTAYVLNVRARPGVSADNPPVDRLVRGTEVFLYEEATVGSATWYRIGIGRWVHGSWIRIVTTGSDAQPDAQPTVCNPPDGPRLEQLSGASLPVGWVVSSTLNVRAEPTTASAIVGKVYHNQSLNILEERTVGGQKWYRIGADRWVYGAYIGVARFKARPASIRPDERWVGVNLSEQTVVAYEGDKPVYAALAATGLPRTPTVQGVFRTWMRLISRKMVGGSAATGGYYYLEEVPWTCYFYSGYSLHGAYWHDAFGSPRSHGCVNLSPYDAWWIFKWSEPGGANSPAVYVYWS